MKKLVLILLTLGIASLANAQIKKTSQSEKFKNKLALDKKYKVLSYKPEKEKFYIWDSTTTQWNIAKTTEFSYNSMGLIDQLISKDQNGIFMAKETNTYSGKNLTEHVMEQWINNAWVNSYRVKIWYDANSEPIKEESSSWNNNKWEVFFGFSSHKSFDQLTSTETVLDSLFDGTTYSLFQKTVSHFNVSGLPDSQTVYSTFGGSILQPDFRALLTYNSTNLIDSIIQQIWDNSAWQNERSTSRFEYDNQNRVLSFRDNLWDGTSWVFKGKTENSYMPFDGIETIEYLNEIDTLIYYRKYVFLNDSLSNQILAKYEDWDGTKWVTNMYESISYIYDSNGNILEDVSKFKDINGNYVNNIKREYLNYILLGVDHSRSRELVLYPNPTFDKVYVKGQIRHKSEMAKITNNQGKVLKTINLENTNEIDISDLPNGVYFINIDGEVYKVLKY